MLGRVQVPPSVKKGEAFEVRVLVQHPMETGFRRDANGQTIPAHVVTNLVATYAGREVFRADLGTGISANPYLTFFVRAQESGELAIEWVDDRGGKGRVTAQVKVAP
jgi:thiosulfate oxidation carrier complex protein SoxZ